MHTTMGVKLLNTFLRNNCKNSIHKVDLNALSESIIAIDTSIYLYRFKGDNALKEYIFTMCGLFYKYNIVPLFVFDGKPPKEKYKELRQRAEEKRKAEDKYNRLKEQLSGLSESDKQEVELKLDKLRKKFIRITKADIQNVKKIIQGYGFSYIDAVGEADVLCSYLAIHKKVDYCLSEDMDMFVYGCPNIIRYFSLLHHNCVVYNLENILKQLNINHTHFQEMCIMSGTDYNRNSKTLYTYYNKYLEFKKDEPCNSFIDYICNKYNYTDKKKLHKTHDMFLIKDRNDLLTFKKLKIKNGIIMYNSLYEIMEEDNFIFL